MKFQLSMLPYIFHGLSVLHSILIWPSVYKQNIFIRFPQQFLLSYKKKLNPVWTEGLLTLALLIVFAPTEAPSALACCHAAVKPTNFDTLLNHNHNLKTDTLLLTQFDNSCKDLLESPSQAICMSWGTVMLCCSQPCGAFITHALPSFCNSCEDLLYSLLCSMPCSHQSPFRTFVVSSSWFPCLVRKFSDSSLNSLTSNCWFFPTVTVIT